VRISSLSVSDQLGGSEAALVAIIRGLRASRPDWTFQVVLPGRGPLLARVEESGATAVVIPMPAPLARLGESAAVRAQWNARSTAAFAASLASAAASLPAYQRRVDEALSTFDADVVHTNGFKAHVVGARLARPGRALAWHLHEYLSPRRLTRRLMRHYVGRADAIIANSRSVADDAGAVLGRASIDVVHNGVDLRDFSPDGPTLDLDRLAALPPADAVRVGLVATFSRWKGHEVFVKAMREVSDRAPSLVRGYIVGGPLYDTSGSQFSRAEMEQLIESHDLGARVGLTGFVGAPAAMRSLDVVVHASTDAEPFGLVVAEAMACGRPVVTTGRGGTAEFVEDGRTALVVRAGDAPALAAAILRLAADSTLRTSIGARARAAAMEQFAPDRVAAGVAAIFERIVRQPSA
jgi:glycosyltransferase involved in cell wall biosynthesis